MSKNYRGFAFTGSIRWILAVILCLGVSSQASAQKNKKDKDFGADQSDPGAPKSAMPDTDQIEDAIGQMLTGFQLNNIDLMHKFYSDNATFVSGEYEPPVVGWQNYAKLYKQESSAFQAMQISRKNTLIFVHGDVAWAMYQWEFDSMLNGVSYSLRGQTTLIFNKVDGNWLIVHNHTSQIVPLPGQQTSAQPGAPRP
jgi:ketosteroid isomerase-like protein